MKTAQQIIEPLIFPDKVVLETVGEDIRFVSANDAMIAMEKYAKAYHESRMKEEFIAFSIIWNRTKYISHITIEDVDDYLATRKQLTPPKD